MNSDIVGAVGYYAGGNIQSGRMIAFTPDGGIRRDVLDANPFSAASVVTKVIQWKQGRSAAWVDKILCGNPLASVADVDARLAARPQIVKQAKGAPVPRS